MIEKFSSEVKFSKLAVFSFVSGFASIVVAWGPLFLADYVDISTRIGGMFLLVGLISGLMSVPSGLLSLFLMIGNDKLKGGWMAIVGIGLSVVHILFLSGFAGGF